MSEILEGLKRGKRSAPLDTKLRSAMCLCLGIITGREELLSRRILPWIIHVYSGCGKRSMLYFVEEEWTEYTLELDLGLTNTSASPID